MANEFSGPICDECAREHGPLWAFEDSWFFEPCKYCQAPTKSRWDGKIPTWVLQASRMAWESDGRP